MCAGDKACSRLARVVGTMTNGNKVRDSQLSRRAAMRLGGFEAMPGPVLPGFLFSGETRKLDFVKNLEYARKEHMTHGIHLWVRLCS